jgi:hypothetical protein
VSSAAALFPYREFPDVNLSPETCRPDLGFTYLKFWKRQMQIPNAVEQIWTQSVGFEIITALSMLSMMI